MRIIRFFTRKTNVTPDDALAVAGRGLFPSDEADGTHISVAFDWDLREVERLARPGDQSHSYCWGRRKCGF